MNINTLNIQIKESNLLGNIPSENIKKKTENSSNKVSYLRKKNLENKDNQIKTFDEIIEEIIPQKKEPYFHELWLQLPILEKKLIENPTEENLEEYKTIVKKIAQFHLEKNIKIENIKRKTQSGKEILLTYVKIIDDKLHKMLIAIQSKKNTAFEILRNLKDIRGLLLDLKQ